MDKIYKMLGLMSGSSLDGLDIAYCEFEHHNSSWSYKIGEAETYPYPEKTKETLQKIPSLKTEEVIKLDHELGAYFGALANQFINEKQVKAVDYIASHGHTAFHNPEAGYTFQIGNGADIAAKTKIPVICDFRSLDVALGGQGAPLVPIGDRHLFAEYQYCLNLGGYSNISYEKNNKRIAFDICPVNKVINALANQTGQELDFQGEIAKRGKIHQPLLQALNNLEYYNHKPPKSLGDSWLHKNFFPVLEKYSALLLEDQMRTLYEHIAVQIHRATAETQKENILVTGGGAHNKFLIERVKALNSNTVLIPDKKLVDYKEALIFAFMGVLRTENKINCLSSVTGAQEDHTGGVIFLAKP